MKKMLKIIGIIVLCIVVAIIAVAVIWMVRNHIDQQKQWLPDEYYSEFKSESALEKKYAGLGSYEVSSMVVKSDDKSIGNYRIWYPTELENSSEKYPLILVANGSNTAALNYPPFFSRLASWGFIVVGNDDRQCGSGESMSKTLDYILDLNKTSDSVLYGKVDEENIGITGYSQGGAAALRAVTEFDNSNKYKTIFTGSAAYPLLAKNMGWGYEAEKINIPYCMTAGTGQSDDNGKSIDSNEEMAGVCPLEALKRIYGEIDDSVFKVRARATGAEHGEVQMRTDGYMTAWMLYQLCGDEEAAKVFIGEDAELLNNSNWQDIEKNQ